MNEKKVTLKLNEKEYPILIGAGALNSLVEQLPAEITSIVIFSDRRLTKARKNLLQILKAHKLPVHEIPLSAGEKLKSIKSLYPLYGQLIKLKADRRSLIIALGGGSIGDAVGFIAATYMRGISWLGIPTTLLAQVDSSVGGKTGINHEAGKNLIGAFHQPALVVCDTDFLKSLGSREIVSGLGEVVKYGITFDPDFFYWLEKKLSSLQQLSSQDLAIAIEKSLQWKARMVEKDVFDRTGEREILNFGHTFGHALETATKYKKFQHGEAVIWGMRFATELSVVRGHLHPKAGVRIQKLLAQLSVPAIPTSIKKQQIFGLMKKDKKAEGEVVRFVLLNDLGKTLSDKKVSLADLEETYERLFKAKRGKKK